jgi:hypothetical protein
VFLVVPDPAHGLVAAPQPSDDLTPATEQALAAQGFTWNGEIEAYTREAVHGPAAVDDTADTASRCRPVESTTGRKLAGQGWVHPSIKDTNIDFVGSAARPVRRGHRPAVHRSQPPMEGHRR